MVIGRILSLGFPLPGPAGRQLHFLSAPSFFDYDAIVVDPQRALAADRRRRSTGRSRRTTFAGAPIVQRRRRRRRRRRSADVLLRRRDETARAARRRRRRRLLRASDDVASRRSPASTRSTTTTGCRDAAPPLRRRRRVAGARRRLPASARARSSHGQLREPRLPRALRRRGAAPARVFARSHGGAAIGVELPRERGRVIFLPALRPRRRATRATRCRTRCRRASGARSASWREGRPPGWLSGYPLPGLDERAAALDAAQRGARRGAERVDGRGGRARRAGALPAAALAGGRASASTTSCVEALRLIGFEVYAHGPRARLELRADGVGVLFEIEASEHADRPGAALPAAPAHRAGDRAAGRGAARRAVRQRPAAASRPRSGRTQSPTRCALAAETMRYCIAPTTHAVRRRRARSSAATTRRSRRTGERLVATDGLLA